MNTPHLKNLKNSKKEFPKATFLSMIPASRIFIIVTLLIAVVNPEKQTPFEKQINVFARPLRGFPRHRRHIGIPWLTWLLPSLLSVTQNP
ncbi:MAG: hypothetical protein U0K19_00525 [Bifidobacteriaceae bacterium]|nr:hypothetical protein [Bifidobacteriaceae bacterium]